MSTKKERPVIQNPLADMGFENLVRTFTTSEPEKQKSPAPAPTQATDPVSETIQAADIEIKPKKRLSNGIKKFEENLEKYTGISEQGVAIWLPKEVKKKLDMIRACSERNIPLRSLAAAIVMTYLEENETYFNDL